MFQFPARPVIITLSFGLIDRSVIADIREPLSVTTSNKT